jgi:hypothetical protein
MGRNLVLATALFAMGLNLCFAQTVQTTRQKENVENKASSMPSATAPKAEDWTTLSAEKSGLKPPAIAWAVIGKSELPEYTSELLRVQWRGGDPIDLYVIRPHGVEKPPVILYLYSFPADTDRFRQDAWCKYVTKDGFAAVGFVSALTGQRYHTRPMREWFISELQESLGTSTHDVQMIIDYLATRGDIDTTEVGMLGQGSGGTIAILAAAADSRIAFVDTINLWGDWPDWLKESPIIPEDERANYLKPEFLTKVAMLDPLLYLPQLKAGRVRVEQVIGDPVTPKTAQGKLAASVPGVDAVVQYKDTTAQIRAWTGQKWWLKEQLRISPSTTKAENNTH